MDIINYYIHDVFLQKLNGITHQHIKIGKINNDGTTVYSQ